MTTAENVLTPKTSSAVTNLLFAYKSDVLCLIQANLPCRGIGIEICKSLINNQMNLKAGVN